MSRTKSTEKTEQHRELLDTGVAITGSTLAHDTADHFPEVKAEFNVEFDVVSDPDPRLGSSAVRAERTYNKMDMATRLSRLTQNHNTIIQPMSAAGTGIHLRKMADIRGSFPPMIDLLVQSHRLHAADDIGGIEAKRLLLAALAYPQLDPGALMINHRQEAIGMGKVTNELARLLVAAAHLDITNFQDRCYTANYQRLKIGGMAQDQLAQVIERQAREATGWFTPADWAPWTDNHDATAQNAPRTVVAIIPESYDRINGGGMNLTPRTADVDAVHLLTVVPISTQWVEQELMAGAIEFLEDRILGDDSNPLWYAWRWQCRQFGIRDPEAEFQRIYEEYLSAELL